MELIEFSYRHIDVEVEKLGEKFRFTGFYGEWDRRRRDSWALLECIKDKSRLPWLAGGDFNEILTHSGKVGGRRRAEDDMAQFRAALSCTGLHDVRPNKGWERMDRFTASRDWLLNSPQAFVSTVMTTESDHAAILLNSKGDDCIKGSRGRHKQFHFENC
ncbi:uncharacterized protein LOC120161058 [Hibiscus syriacus]|uniref:uncharacterized protein LOC120161058 n=1 Tax=Hibiscus syriacus TaxID=106335 RepID=UPI0019232B08|nr:uncharacterized protein LOC120161058 [Hibiscus syriacus]